MQIVNDPNYDIQNCFEGPMVSHLARTQDLALAFARVSAVLEIKNQVHSQRFFDRNALESMYLI